MHVKLVILILTWLWDEYEKLQVTAANSHKPLQNIFSSYYYYLMGVCSCNAEWSSHSHVSIHITDSTYIVQLTTPVSQTNFLAFGKYCTYILELWIQAEWFVHCECEYYFLIAHSPIEWRQRSIKITKRYYYYDQNWLFDNFDLWPPFITPPLI